MDNTAVPNRRSDDKRYACDLARELNINQRLAIRNLESFGWQIQFIRKPLFRPSVVVIADADRKTYAVVEDDGTVNEKHDLVIRPARS